MKNVLAAILLSLGLAACASPAQVDNMVLTSDQVEKFSANSKFFNKIKVEEAMGGKETNPLWTSQVDAESFRAALIKSLKNSGLLCENPEDAQYTLKTNLISLDQPLMGLNMTVTSKVSYNLEDVKTNNTVLDKELSTPYTAKFGDALSGVARLRMANEGAIRESISALLQEVQAMEN